MRTAALDYELPEDLIAQHPCARRDEARLLVVDRAKGAFHADVFRNLADYLREGDCLVLNDTRVIRARLRAVKSTGGHVEILLLHERSPGEWEALVRPSRHVKPGARVRIADGVEASVAEVLPGGRRRVVFDIPDVLPLLESIGEIPLPPYIRRDSPEAGDGARYQTIYACAPGAVAAPTAGLHYTPEVFASLEQRGIRRAHLTLHVGYGTFRPIQAETLDEHHVDAEDFDLPEETVALLNETRAASGRIVAVGTTSARVLETQFHVGAFWAGSGRTDRYIFPPYTFHAVDVLQTNFHLPRSSLLALVCAFGGTDLIMEAYRYAVSERFRFYSYGDAMLVV